MQMGDGSDTGTATSMYAGYTTPDLIEWFEHITDASEELREEFDLMVDSGGTE